MKKTQSRKSNFFADRELEYMLSAVKVTMKRGLPTLETISFQLDETKEGELVEIPRWVGEVLVEMDFAELQSDPFEVEIFKALTRERIQGALQLATLKGDFYLKMRRYLETLKTRSEKDGDSKPDFEKSSISAYDLISLRLSKLLYLATSSAAPKDIFEKITPEEKELFNEIHQMVVGWRKAILEGES